MKYDLEERCCEFSESVIDFLKCLPKNKLLDPMTVQLVRSATSIGANYMEANQASSKKDFRNKVTICKKEANESKYWLRIIAHTDEISRDQARKLWSEAHELLLIFGKIESKSREKV
jgi:four helix bundle protein